MNKSHPADHSKVVRFRNQSGTEQIVINYVAYFMNIDQSQITLNSRLVRDLAIDGRDAAEFILVFSQRYNLDTSGFDASVYFHATKESRPLRLLASIGRILTGRIRPPHDIKDLRVCDLVRAVEQKRLPPA